MGANGDDPIAPEMADVIPFELLKLDRAVAARLEEVLDFVPDSKKLVKEAFRKLRGGDRTALEGIDGEVREHLEAEMLRLIQTDPGLREIVKKALMDEAEASLREDRSRLLDADLTPGEREAVRAFRASLDDDEQDRLYALMTTGAGASQRNEDRFASALFNEAIASAPDYFEAYLLRGVNHARSGRHASALQDAEEALRLCPDSARAFELKASALRGLDREEESMQVLGTAIGMLATSSGLRVLRGAGFVRREAYKDAVRDLDVAVQQGGGTLAHVLRGEARLGVDAFASAQKDFEAALATNPDHPRALGGLVQCLSRRRSWSDLEEAATRLIETHGPDPEALSQRAHARLELGKSFMALLDGMAALSVEEHKKARRWSDSAVARLGLEPETGADELAVALENCELLELNGLNATRYLDRVENVVRAETFAVTMARAVLARTHGSPAQVHRLAERARRLPGATNDALYLIAGARLEAEDYEGALRAVDAIVEAGDDGAFGWDMADALLVASAAAEESAGPEQALTILEGHQPDHRVLREVGRIRAILGDDPGARTALRAAFDAAEEDPNTLFENARFEASRDPDAALDFLTRLVDVAPHYGWALTGERSFDVLHDDARFDAILRDSSTVAATVRLWCDFDEVNAFAARQGWVWEWLGRKTLGRHRLVSWSVAKKEATAFYIDDAVSNIRALLFYGADAADAAEASRRELEGTMQLSVTAVSTDPLVALEQLRVAGWATAQGLAREEQFEELVLEALCHEDPHVTWRAVAAASQADESDAIDSALREIAQSADEERVREEALFSLRQSEGHAISVLQHVRWESYLVRGDRDVVERALWDSGLTFVGESEPDERSDYELIWATADGGMAASYVEDERHDVSLVSFAGDPEHGADVDELVKSLAAQVPLLALEDLVAEVAREPTPARVRALGALLPEEEVSEVTELVARLEGSEDPVIAHATIDYLSGQRDWLPAPERSPQLDSSRRFILSPMVLPREVSRFAANEGFVWHYAQATPDREHPSPSVRWESEEGSAKLTLRLHRFGFWSLDLTGDEEDLESRMRAAIDTLDRETLLGRTRHPDASVRADAVHQLGIVAALEPTEPIVETIRARLADPSLEVRTHALESACIAAELVELREAVAQRVEVKEDPDLRDYAAVLVESL